MTNLMMWPGATHLRMLQAIDYFPRHMASTPSLGRTVTSRDRFARSFALGDRSNPAAHTPTLVLTDEEDSLGVEDAPFQLLRNPNKVPAELTLRTRSKLCPPFEEIVEWHANEGLSLPPSLIESDAGTFPYGADFLPITAQSLFHDARIANIDEQPSIVCFVDALQLVNNDDLLIKSIDSVKRRFPSSLIWLPGVSGPDNCPLLAWMGVDLMDLIRVRRAFSNGIHISAFGPRKIEQSLDMESAWRSQIHAWKESIKETRHAILNGKARLLAEASSLSSPRSVQRLRRYDKYMSKIAILDPGRAGLASAITPGKILQCNSRSSRDDPLIKHWQERVANKWIPSPHQSRIAVLLPCSAVKPYRRSPSHARFRQAINSRAVSELMITAPLGIVPRDLELLWPASSYDIPVIGEWDVEELKIIRDMLAEINSRAAFDVIINHTGIDIELSDTIVIDTRGSESAGSERALDLLSSAVRENVEMLNQREPKRSRALLESFRSISRHLLNGDNWLSGARVTGKAPDYRIMIGSDQIALWDSKRGRFAFSKKALGILDENNQLPKVLLSEGFKWSGDIFSTNISDFSGSPRVGDDVLVYQGGELVGSARAVAPSWEWPTSPGTLARARHRI
jgi:archaeosine synthase